MNEEDKERVEYCDKERAEYWEDQARFLESEIAKYRKVVRELKAAMDDNLYQDLSDCKDVLKALEELEK